MHFTLAPISLVFLCVTTSRQLFWLNERRSCLGLQKKCLTQNYKPQRNKLEKYTSTGNVSFTYYKRFIVGWLQAIPRGIDWDCSQRLFTAIIEVTDRHFWLRLLMRSLFVSSLNWDVNTLLIVDWDRWIRLLIETVNILLIEFVDWNQLICWPAFLTYRWSSLLAVIGALVCWLKLLIYCCLQLLTVIEALVC